MVYEFKCEDKDCTGVAVHEQAMSDKTPLPKTLVCPTCGKTAYRDFGGSTTIIPDHMKAATGGDDFTMINQRMKHAPRPSGRQRALY